MGVVYLDSWCNVWNVTPLTDRQIGAITATAFPINSCSKLVVAFPFIHIFEFTFGDRMREFFCQSRNLGPLFFVSPFINVFGSKRKVLTHLKFTDLT